MKKSIYIKQIYKGPFIFYEVGGGGAGGIFGVIRNLHDPPSN